jgi:hypothetical protein
MTAPRRALRLLALAAVAAALAGCAATGTGDDGGAADGSATVRDQALPIWREAAECIRAHGYPDFPDPEVADDGTVKLPEEVGRKLDGNREAQRACEPILARLPASVRQAMEGPTATPEEVAQLRRFAACMRQNGLPDWPDPGSDGAFPLTDEIEREGKSPRVLNGMRTCKDLNPDSEKGIKFSSREKGS